MAVCSHRRLESPLDVINGRRNGVVPSRVAPPVGRLTIELRERASQSDSLRLADVAVIIKTDAAPVKLNGIVVKEPRPGWVTLDVPPLEAWEKPLRWLLTHQRERVVTPEFFHLLQEHVTRRFLGKRPAA